MSSSASVLIGPAWFLGCVAIVRAVSLEAGLALALLSLIAVLAWRVPGYMPRV